MNGLMTEREWRRQAARAKPPRPVCWGRACVLPAKRRKKLREDPVLFCISAAAVAVGGTGDARADPADLAAAVPRGYHGRKPGGCAGPRGQLP